MRSFFVAFIYIVCVGLDDEAKSVLVEKQKNDSAPGPSSNSLISRPGKRKRGGKMEKDEKEYLDYLFAKFVATSTTPTSIGDNEQFMEFVKELNPEVCI